MPVLAEDIDVDLARRQKGYGRGGRQQIEHDCVEIVAGVRHGRTMGGPIAMVVKNRDWANWQGKMDIEPVPEPPPPVTRLRPGHADLAGVVKYGLDDVRNVLERASARETASRVAAGALGKVFLRQFGIEVRSHVRSDRLGARRSRQTSWRWRATAPRTPWWTQVEESPIRTGDTAFEEQAIELIKAARTAGDTLGGIFEVIAYGLPIGLGTYGQWDERLDGRLAAAVMSIQSIKGVELGDGFANAGAATAPRRTTSSTTTPRAAAGSRPTNRAGGLEGGVTNGAPLVVRGAAKPISTLIHPLPSIDYATRERRRGARRAQRRVRRPGGGRRRRGDGRARAGRRDARQVRRRQPRGGAGATSVRIHGDQMDNLILVGFSCSGKTTLGRNVARRLRLTFVDTDRFIEEMTGRTIPDIFREDGEAAFRAVEREAIEPHHGRSATRWSARVAARSSTPTIASGCATATWSSTCRSAPRPSSTGCATASRAGRGRCWTAPTRWSAWSS